MEDFSDLLKAQIRQHLGDAYLMDDQLKNLLYAINQVYQTCETEQILQPSSGTKFTPASENFSLFKSMLDDQTELICRFKKDGTLTYVNKAYCRYFGKEKEQLIGKSFLPVIPEEDLTYIKQQYATITPENAVVRNEHRVIMPDGEVRWHQWTDKAFFNNQGEVTEMLGIGRDITDQKKAALALKESEERYKTLFEAAFEGIAVHDQGIILEVNQASLAALQYTPEDVIGKHLLSFVVPELQEEVKIRISNKPDEPYETVLIKKDGSYLPVEILSKKHQYKGKEVRVAAFRDISQRKLYEKEIHTQKSLFNTILNKLPIDIFIKDREGRYVFINRHIAQTLDMLPTDMLGKTDFDIFNEETASRLATAEKKVWKSKKLISGEEKISYKDQTMYVLSGKIIVQTDEEAPLLLGYFIDITGRAKAEEELRTQETFIRQVLDTGPNLIFVKDLEGNFLMVNQATADLYGMEKEELIFQNNYRLHTQKEENEHFRNTDRQVIEQGITIELQEPFTRPTGETFWFHTIKKPLYLKDGSVQVLAMSQDITDQKKTLEKLKNSELKYRQLVECASDMIYGSDHKGYLIYANPVACHVLGYSEDQLLGRHYSEFVVTEYIHILEDFYRKQYYEQIPDTYIEFKGITGKGEIIWVGQSVHMLMEGDLLKGFQTVARNITERKKVENELIHAKQEAEKSMRAKEQFLSVMSHEIRTPLNAVIGLTHLLLEENPLPEQIEQLQAIKFSADNLMVIINDILDFSKIESGKITFEQIDFETVSVFKGIQQSLNFKAEEKNLRLLFNIDKHIPAKLCGDPVRLNQILLNLVSNAIKFTEKGYVEVNARVIKQQVKGVTIEFRVSDTGIGIETDKLSSIFESFTQASSETTRKYGGTGLGLTITKRLIELQGGSIKVSSKLGMGSEFAFELTFSLAARQITRNQPQAVDEFSHSLRGLKILLVEDNKMNQMVACKFLKKWGVETDIAADGMEAIDKLKTNWYQLILMDLQMPTLDGYATTRFIRNNMQEYLKHIPILALTASALMNVKQNTLEAGMNDFITKPFEPKDLYAKLLKYSSSSYAMNIQSQPASLQKFQHIDLNYLEDVSASDKKFIKEMIRLFMKQTPGFIDILQRATQTADWANIRYMAHKMKATIAMMGIAELQPIIMQLEKYASQESQLAEVATLVKKISTICDEVYEELEQRLEFIG
ncbi:PAS domain S-box protein [Rhodocytophaga rosea]|uniref:histidine kinase n=1 Tax=Rhodocytophaga rosea TaxID=2704465 RepID=A0A6C0GJK0_9BACT|nr:PAS domain S-box protein [Rhodocytophaga rosea]QHT68216.1 PAS domain S-box protein [Rhodocytophaga rosea]